jgi:serine/threonine-protein kinase
VGIVLAGAGVVSLALGTGFALAAHRTNDDIDQICVNNVCPVEARDLVDQEHAQAARANIALGLGFAALAGGAIVYFTAPASRSPKTGRASAAGPASPAWGLGTAVAPGGAGLVASGRF